MSASPTLTELKSAAKQLREGGFALCRVDPGEKKPTYQGWSTKSVEPKDFTVGSSIGIQGGPLSDGNTPGHALVIVDLDAEAAVTTADDHLPETGMIEGRSGKPRSHRYFLVPLDSIPAWATSNAPQGAKAAKETKGHAGPFKKAFQHSETGKTVIDFIGTGGQAVCPPSLHTSGEPREWEGGTPGSPAIVEFVDLWRAVCELAIGCGCTIPHTHEAKPRPSRQATRSPENLTERARGYLAKMDAAISGCGGRSKLFTAARAMVWGFDLDHETAFSLLFNDYNPRCVPPWDERDIRAKIDEVERVPFSKARGHLRDEQKSTTSSRPTAGSSSGCPEAPSEHSPNPDDGSESSQQLPLNTSSISSPRWTQATLWKTC